MTLSKSLTIVTVFLSLSATITAQEVKGGGSSTPNATVTTMGKAKLGQLPTSTMADMPACSSGNDGQLIRVTDGNRNAYKCNGTGGNWVSVNGGVFDVRDFGAKGDGSADDGTAIIAAITAASTNGGTVLVPQGRYKYSTSLPYYSHIVFKGSGTSYSGATGATVLAYTGSDWAIKPASPTTNYTDNSFQDFSIDLTGAASALGGIYWKMGFSDLRNVSVTFYDQPSANQIGLRATEGTSYTSYWNTITNFHTFVQTNGSNVTGLKFDDQANSYTVLGGAILRARYPVVLDNVNDNSFYGLAIDGGFTKAYTFTNSAGFNKVYGGRMEMYTPSLTQIQRASNVVTATAASFAAMGGIAGGTVRLYGCADSSFNGTFTLTGVTATTVTWAQTGADATQTAGVGGQNPGYLAYGVGASFDSGTYTTRNIIHHPSTFNVATKMSDANGNNRFFIDDYDELAMDFSSSALKIRAGSVAFNSAISATSLSLFGSLSQTAVAATGQTGSVSLNLSTGNVRSITFGAGNISSLTATSIPVGPIWISFTQDSTGGRTISAWNSLFLFAGGTRPTLTTTANATDQFGFLCNGTTCTLVSAIYDVK